MPSRDPRAVTTQIGAVLLLGILVILLTAYQATIVPEANAETEFDHSRAVLDELQTLQAEYHNAMSTGTDVESTVTLGTDYSSRLLAINPPPASGRLATTAEGSIRSDGIDIGAICGQGGTTRALQYEPNYHEYRDAPTITFESSVLYSDFGDEYIVESEQSIISGTQLELTPLDGTISETGTGRESIRFRAGPKNTTEETVSGELRLTIPTEIPADQWEDDPKLLADELVSNGGQVDRVEENASADGVDIILEDGTYDVSCRASGVTDEPSSGSAGDGSGDGSASGNIDPGVGQGGESDYANTETETVSAPGGVWTGVNNVNSIRLERPRFSPTDPADGTPDEAERYFNLGLMIGNDTREYVFIIGTGGDTNALRYEQEANGRSWAEKRRVVLYKYTEGEKPTDLFDKEDLTKSGLNNVLDGGLLDILNKLYYTDPSKVESGLKEVRAFLNNSDSSEIFITDMHGRTDITLGQRANDNEAYFLSIDDDDKNTKTHAVQPTDTSNYSMLKFGLVNELSTNQIEDISNISITITDGPTAERVENYQMGTGEYVSEVYFDGNNREGYINSSFNTSTSTSFEQTAGIDEDSGVEIYVNGFRDGDDNPVDLEVGDEIETTFEYVVDGETYTQTLTFEVKQRSTE
jgi:hypothetical protein